MNTIKAVCVYCGSSPGSDTAYVYAAEQFGTALAAAKLKLIFGGGTTGVMGAVARGALDGGGQVGAVIPQFLIGRETTEAAVNMFGDLTLTQTMHERKQEMFKLSDAFVALPGGIGTVEEIVEIMTWGQLGQHQKPIVLANIGGFWNPLLALLEHLRDTGFIHSGHLLRPIVVDRIDEIIPAIVSAAAKVHVSDLGISASIEKM